MRLSCSIFGHRLEYGELHFENRGPGPDFVHRDGKPYRGNRCTRCDEKFIDHRDDHNRTEALIAKNWEVRRKAEEANEDRLRNCHGHVFDMPYNRGHFRICSRCKGEVGMSEALWYERGVRHGRSEAGGDP